MYVGMYARARTIIRLAQALHSFRADDLAVDEGRHATSATGLLQVGPPVQPRKFEQATTLMLVHISHFGASPEKQLALGALPLIAGQHASIPDNCGENGACSETGTL